jgi:sulfhydrogenase subunit gamma (sulfur reductase)
MKAMEDIYTPHPVTVTDIHQETPDIRTFRLEFHDNKLKKAFDFQPGQFALYSVFGHGEAPFCIASSPTRQGYVECSIKRVGKVTNAFHELNVGDTIGFRGPYGNGFPVEEMRGKNLVFAGGGIGLAPLRSLIWYCLDKRDQFGDITIVYGARSIADLVYKRELEQWMGTEGIRTVLTVDPGGEDETWKGDIGFVPAVLEKASPSPENALVITCGPPIMIKFVLVSLSRMRFAPDQIITTLEMKMKCGLGKCGRCNIGPAYVCKHGPVFDYEQLKQLPAEY